MAQERRRQRALRDQLPSVAPLLGGWLIAAVGLAAVAAQSAVPLETLFLDATFLTGEPWYTGVLSDLAVFGWTTATVSAVGGAWVASQTDRPSAARFLRGAALVSAVLLADDLFQLHADFLRILGIPKIARQVLIVAPAVFWLARYLGEILRTRWVVLLGALSGFATSVVVDTLAPGDSRIALFIEDSAKLLGVLAWAQYLVLTSRDIARSTIREAKRGGPVPLDDRLPSTTETTLRGRDLRTPGREPLPPTAAAPPGSG